MLLGSFCWRWRGLSVDQGKQARQPKRWDTPAKSRSDTLLTIEKEPGTLQQLKGTKPYNAAVGCSWPKSVSIPAVRRTSAPSQRKRPVPPRQNPPQAAELPHRTERVQQVCLARLPPSVKHIAFHRTLRSCTLLQELDKQAEDDWGLLADLAEHDRQCLTEQQKEHRREQNAKQRQVLDQQMEEKERKNFEAEYDKAIDAELIEQDVRKYEQERDEIEQQRRRKEQEIKELREEQLLQERKAKTDAKQRRMEQERAEVEQAKCVEEEARKVRHPHDALFAMVSRIFKAHFGFACIL